MDKVKNANIYVLNNKYKVNKTYRNKFHMEPTIGWMNDPNGLIFFDGEFHLFYQHYPYNSLPGDMGWGHFVSKDLIRYEEVDIALMPEGKENGECGCWTGSSFIEDKKMKIVYTRHFDRYPEANIQTQHFVLTDDNINFKKENLPCIDNNELPNDLSTADFRDPQIFYYDEKCYMIIGCQNINKQGVFVIYSGNNSNSLHYDFTFGPYKNTEKMVECPSFFRVGDIDVIVYSSFRDDGTNGVFYLLGEFDPKNKKFNIVSEGEIDRGDAFYAPKVIENYEIKTIVGWMENWNKKYMTDEMNHGYTGAFTIPRIIDIRDNKLYQTIHPNLFRYIKEEKELTSDDYIHRHSLNSFEFCSDFEIILEGNDGKLIIYKKDDSIYLDMNFSNNLHEMIHQSKNRYESGNLEFLLDTSSIEIFINLGIETITSRFYILGDKFKVYFKGLEKITSKKIVVE